MLMILEESKRSIISRSGSEVDYSRIEVDVTWIIQEWNEICVHVDFNLEVGCEMWCVHGSSYDCLCCIYMS